jgi:NAD(P)H-dependent FMN reductase
VEWEPNNTLLRVVGICGSLREPSYTRFAVRIALHGAAELGAQTHLIDLRQYALAFCDGRRDHSTYPQDVARLCQEVAAAQGIILGTPVYHGSFSGALKNALDLMGFRELEGKMIGLVGVSAGRTGAGNALNALRIIGRSLHAWVIPEEVSISEVSKAFDTVGDALDPELERRLKEVGRQVTRFAFLHTSQQALDFVRLWETAPVNPGA